MLGGQSTCLVAGFGRNKARGLAKKKKKEQCGKSPTLYGKVAVDNLVLRVNAPQIRILLEKFPLFFFLISQIYS